MEQQPVMQISYSLSNIENAVHQLWEYAHQYKVWALSGDMGAGKTTLVHALCDMLGVTDDVSSPTFALINHYDFDDNGTRRRIYHMDWYRLRDEDEAINAGMEDCLLQKDNYSIVEWPERAQGILPFPHLWLRVQATGPDERTITVLLKNHK